MNLENRGNGSWRLTISDGYNPNGSKIRFHKTIKVDPSKTINAQRREAEKQATQIEADYRRKLLTSANKITIKELAEEYMQDYVRRRGLAASTAKQYRDLLDGRILPALGKKCVQDLTVRDVNGFYRSLEEASALTNRSRTGKLSGTTQRKYSTMLHSLLAYAIRAGYIAVNVAEAAEAPRKDTQETRFYELEDVARLLNALDAVEDTQWQLFFYMALYTGMRPGEIIGLNWSDISGNTLWVNASAVHIKGGHTVRTERPKTKKSIRPIVLPQIIVDMLAVHRREQLAYRLPFGTNWPEPDAVFTTDIGYRMNISSPTQKFAKLIRTNGLKPLPLYGLRHTAATTMIASGMNPRDVAYRLGHSQTSTTLNIYAHAFADANARATDALVSAFESARAQNQGQ